MCFLWIKLLHFQISAPADTKKGVVNRALEVGERKESMVNYYDPCGKLPSGNTLDVVKFVTEKNVNNNKNCDISKT